MDFGCLERMSSLKSRAVAVEQSQGKLQSDIVILEVHLVITAHIKLQGGVCSCTRKPCTDATQLSKPDVSD